MDISSICNPTLPTDPDAPCVLRIEQHRVQRYADGASRHVDRVAAGAAGSRVFSEELARTPQCAATILQNSRRSSVSRTIPITTSAPPQSGATTDPEGPTVGYEFDSGGVVQGTNWNGVLTRSKIKCSSGGVAESKPVERLVGRLLRRQRQHRPDQANDLHGQPDQVGSTASATSHVFDAPVRSPSSSATVSAPMAARRPRTTTPRFFRPMSFRKISVWRRARAAEP